ncbi:MAG: NAD(P)-dependent oxidoreductase [Planctomycetota bacterium]
MPDIAARRIVVTGATGFLGRHLVRALLGQGIEAPELRLLARDVTKAGGLPLASVFGADLLDLCSLERAVDGADVVFHLAGAVKSWNRRGYFETNETGTRNLARALRSRAPSAFVVHVSSLAAAGPSVDGSGTNAPPDRCRPVSLYGRSKVLGEIAMLDEGLAPAIVRPCAVYGPADAATRLLFRQALGRFAAVPARRVPLSIVHVDDVVALLLAVARARCRGRILPIDGPERTDSHDLMRSLARACDREARLIRVPRGLAVPAAMLADLMARARRRASFFSRDKIREVYGGGWVADGTEAASIWKPCVRLREGLRRVAIQEGFVRREERSR